MNILGFYRPNLHKSGCKLKVSQQSIKNEVDLSEDEGKELFKKAINAWEAPKQVFIFTTILYLFA